METNYTWKIWDTKEKSYFGFECHSLEIADIIKEGSLSDGNYPDDPHTVLQIHEFLNGEFNKEII